MHFPSSGRLTRVQMVSLKLTAQLYTNYHRKGGRLDSLAQTGWSVIFSPKAWSTLSTVPKFGLPSFESAL